MRQQVRRGSKELWRAVNKLNIYQKKPKPKIPDNLSDVNQINDFFINSIPKISTSANLNQYYNGHMPNLRSTLDFKIIDEIEIMLYLSLIKTSAVGADGLNINFIFLCCPFLITYICHIVNYCILKSVYPSSWKIAHVVPLPKASEVLEHKDLRPISILPILSKILERAIKKQLVGHIGYNEVLPDTQSGFVEYHGCETAELNVTDNILRATDSGRLTVLVLLDYSKAFDTLNHDTLKLILKYVGLSESAVAFFDSYLSDRRQRVVLNGQVSDVRNISSGVPQGSILGPILFIIYTAFLKNVLSYCSTQMYADDTQIFYSFFPKDADRACELINQDLNTLYTFSQDHSLFLNPKKTVALLFGKNKDRLLNKESMQLIINNVPVSFSEESKVLGLWLDSELRFDKHISECIRKSIFKLKMLYSSRTMLDTSLKLMLCESLVLSTFNHCNVVYGPCLTAANCQRIQKIQNYCLRFAYGIRRRCSVRHKLKDAGWLSMKQRRTFHSAVLFHKIMQLKKPSYLHKKIIFRTDVHNLNVRFKGTITPPIHKTSLFERSFSYNVSALYNAIPTVLKSKSILSFKKAYKSVLLRN